MDHSSSGKGSEPGPSNTQQHHRSDSLRAQDSLPAYAPVGDGLPISPPLTPAPPQNYLPEHEQTIIEQQDAGPGEVPPPAYDDVYGTLDLTGDSGMDVGGHAQVAGVCLVFSSFMLPHS